MDDILHAFASAGEGFPRAAMEQALARWDAEAPRLLAVLADYAEGRDRGEEATAIALHAIYLAAQARERRAFPLLLRLARHEAALDAAIGDGLTEDFPGILAATFDGDLDALLALALDPAADEMVRHAAIEALTLLFATRVLPMARAEPVLRELHGRLLLAGEAPDWVWVGWQQAVSMLGIAALRAEAMALFRAGRIDRSIMSARDFEADLKDGTEPGVDRLELLEEQGVAPLGDVVAMFAEWHRIREAEAAKRAARPAPAPTTAVNPHRDVGRNDPCPCGSGKKFKKCCLAA
ncbi:DUF1186 domain-containing protein [Dankookia rubra]|uniref:DUF1186 domain-containing protein n=1 Tax=Dankookia rubra TaxID=1442381 RepID=UPI00140CBBC7|nr:DUF1186 domain-containing protein [Dankookia rubra]